MIDILIFRTNVHDKEIMNRAVAHLESLNGIKKLTFDLDDIDKVLRIEAVGLPPEKVESAMSSAGFYCEEMND